MLVSKIVNDIEPTSFTDADFIFAFNNRALGFNTLFQQNPYFKISHFL